ncbi:MAG: hypothetical protein M3410_08105 [Acidobacteriota bacterium]|nr:hypothetical protein [Acidobacteriota bacterium]
MKIAEEVSPVETEFAPLWVEAFIKGGKDRKELFSVTNAQASGFLPGELMPTLPVVLKALAVAAPMLLTILRSEVTGNFLESVKNALAVGELLGKGRGWFSAVGGQEAEATLAGESVYARLNEVMAKLDKEVRSLGLSQAKRDRINLVVLRLLLENPPDATRFLGKLMEKQ